MYYTVVMTDNLPSLQYNIVLGGVGNGIHPI